MPKITGRDGVRIKLNDITGPRMVADVGKALFAAGQIIEVEAARSITSNSTNAKGQHVRSLPGQPPNAETGLLDRSIETVLVAPLEVEISANAPYSAHLEYGTSRMAPRPYMGPALQKKKAEAIDLVKRAVAASLKRNS